VTASPGRLVLLGHPVAHSLSPRFQNAALEQAGIALRYEALDVPPGRLAATLAQLAHDGAAGNVTIPHKPAVAAACRRLSPVAERVGAVNTFWHEDGVLVGDNTDVAGFEAMARLLLGARPSDLRVLLLGAGGAAAAVCLAVGRWAGTRLAVWARHPEGAKALATRFPGVTVVLDPAVAAADVDVVVNATPLGLGDGDPFPVPVNRLARDAAVMDLVYRAGETAWVRAARAAGHRAADGRDMLIAQGAHAFERWFGFPPDVAAMRAALAAAT
jgi:shikimate dehydrogenase